MEKGTVERLIGTLMRSVFHLVPGTTYSGIYERDEERPPDTVAESTIEELRRKLLDWIVNEYQYRHHKGIDDIPLHLWKESVAKDQQRLIPPREIIEAA